MSRKRVCFASLMLACAPALAHASGFALFEHGNKSLAMGGAMVAIADDPSAVYWNAAGLAFQERDGVQTMGGFALIMPSQTFVGGDYPYPGPDYTVSQIDQAFYPPHGYLVMPVSDRLTVAGGLTVPFGLGTHWPDDYAGRFISKRVDLKTYDLAASFAYRIGDNLSIGGGVDYVLSQIDLTRNIPFLNPFTQQIADVGQVHLYTDDLFANDGFGWNAGILWKGDGGFNVGASYRSGFDIDYEGEASFIQFPTGSPELDGLLGAALPFSDENIPIESMIDFPESYNLAVAWEGERFTVGLQYGWMGWSSFQELPLIFTTRPDLSDTIIEEYEDSEQYRLGVEWKATESVDLRAGVLWDETPQPKLSMSPLLGDADRTGISAGFQWAFQGWWVDVASMYLMNDDRSTDGESESGFNGEYRSNAGLFGVTFGTVF